MKKAYSIVAMEHCPSGNLVATLAPGTEVLLVREPNNPHDPLAVAVWVDDQHVGYIPRKQNRDLAVIIERTGSAWVPPGGKSTLALDTGRQVIPCVKARFRRSTNSGYPQVEVEN
jgi:hypothetical protein